MRKRVLTLLLALTMCLGLTCTAWAGEKEPDVEGLEAIAINFGDAARVDLEQPVTLYTATHGMGSMLDAERSNWRKQYDWYRSITPDTQITVSNTGTDPSAYIYITYWRYDYYPESKKVDLWINEDLGKIDVKGCYYGQDIPICLSDTERESVPWAYDNKTFFTTTPNINDQYWYAWDYFGGEEAPEYLKVLHAGESATFTIPQQELETDAMYMLQVEIYYPDYDWYYSKSNLLKFGDAPAPAVPSAPEKPAAARASAAPTASTVLVNGEKKAFDAYNIEGSNYFKLRDLAYVLNGTDKQFEVGWDAAANAISLTSGKAYTAAGGEMAAQESPAQAEAVRSSSKILLDGAEAALTAYTINGNNYFKLRDLGQAFDFGVGWDGEAQTISIDTSTGYTAE